MAHGPHLALLNLITNNHRLGGATPELALWGFKAFDHTNSEFAQVVLPQSALLSEIRSVTDDIRQMDPNLAEEQLPVAKFCQDCPGSHRRRLILTRP